MLLLKKICIKNNDSINIEYTKVLKILMMNMNIIYKMKKVMSERRKQIYRRMDADTTSIYYIIHHNKIINMKL